MISVASFSLSRAKEYSFPLIKRSASDTILSYSLTFSSDTVHPERIKGDKNNIQINKKYFLKFFISCILHIF
jgi:hypothetical protein